MKVSDFITRVRGYLGDTATEASGLRTFTDDDMLVPLSDGVSMLYAYQPQGCFVSAVITDTPAEVTSVNEDVPATREYIEPLARFVTGTLMMQDTEDANNITKAQWHMSAFYNAIGAPGSTLGAS